MAIIISIIIALSLVIIGAISLAYSHSSSHKKFWPDTFWDMELSAKRKYKNGNVADGPKFWGSTTYFVWLTDGWHLMNFIFNRCWQGAIAIFFPGYWSLIMFFGIGILFSGIFEQAYKLIKNPPFDAK